MSKKMLTSDNNLIFSYILYLMGRLEYGVDMYLEKQLLNGFSCPISIGDTLARLNLRWNLI